MKIASVIALIAAPLFGQVVITTNPVTPAPHENFTLTVRGVWADGCVPQFQSIAASGTTIQIDASADPCGVECTQAMSPYALDTTAITVDGPGIYTVEYYVTKCNGPRTLVASTTIAVHFHCQFDRSLSAASSQVQAGSFVSLHWCDPSVAEPDHGINLMFFRMLVSRNANGPFVPALDSPIVDATLRVDASDAPSLYFFVEAHMCTETIAGCTGDTVMRTNIVRVDVTSAASCIPTGTTLCLGSGRFQVQAKWKTNSGESGSGQAVALTGNSGYFWFFSADNAEVIVKLLNACAAPAPSFWFFASGLTNVGVDLTVADTKTGATKTYHNPVNQPFVAIQDTSAFSCR